MPLTGVHNATSANMTIMGTFRTNATNQFTADVTSLAAPYLQSSNTSCARVSALGAYLTGVSAGNATISLGGVIGASLGSVVDAISNSGTDNDI